MKPTVWTARRKWMGNVIPALFWAPLAVAGVVMLALQGNVFGTGLWLLGAATGVGWIALNQFGLYENDRMRRQLRRILQARNEEVGDAPFVGMATPTYSSMIDPHEDVGFLMFLPDRLRFVSEMRTLELYREQAQKVRFRPNVHTLLGLGRWISIEGVSNGRPIRLLVEPREKRTLLGNIRSSKAFRDRIRRWIADK
jgi:hypothetical protein